MLIRLKEIADAQNFQREQSASSQANAVNLEKLRAQNSRELAADAETRALKVGKQQQDARDAAELNKQFSMAYPIYAHAAAVLGKKPAARSEYENSWDGLAQLQGDMSDLKEQADKQEKSAAAKGVVAILSQAEQSIADTIKNRDEALQLTESDKAQAKSMGLKSLQTAVANGSVPGMELKDAAFKKAFEALSKDEPDFEVAKRLLGPQGYQAYAGGVQQGILALSNDKERLAKITALNRDVQTAQRGGSDALNRLLQIAATNPELGPMLEEHAKNLAAYGRQATAAPATPDFQGALRNMIGPPPAPTATTLPPSAAPVQPSGIFNLLRPQTPTGPFPAMNLWGAPTIGSGAPAAAPVLSAPPVAPPVTSAPAVRPVLPAYDPSTLTGIGRLPPGGFNTPTMGQLFGVAPPGLPDIGPGIDVDAVLAARPAGPWTPAEQQAIGARRLQRDQGPSLLQRLFPGAR